MSVRSHTSHHPLCSAFLWNCHRSHWALRTSRCHVTAKIQPGYLQKLKFWHVKCTFGKVSQVTGCPVHLSPAVTGWIPCALSSVATVREGDMASLVMRSQQCLWVHRVSTRCWGWALWVEVLDRRQWQQHEDGMWWACKIRKIWREEYCAMAEHLCSTCHTRLLKWVKQRWWMGRKRGTYKILPRAHLNLIGMGSDSIVWDLGQWNYLHYAMHFATPNEMDLWRMTCRVCWLLTK